MAHTRRLVCRLLFEAVKHEQLDEIVGASLRGRTGIVREGDAHGGALPESRGKEAPTGIVGRGAQGETPVQN